MKTEKGGDRLRKKRDRLAAALARQPDWVLGSLVETERVQAGKRSAFRYLSRSVGGRNRIVYVSDRQAAAFRKALRSGKRAWKLFEQIAQINIAIIKGGA